MPKIVADLEKCQGYASCVIRDPSNFDLGTDGKVLVLNQNPDLSDALREAVLACPTHALMLDE